MACKRVTVRLRGCVVSMPMASKCVASRGRGHQISTTFKPSTERLVSIL